MCFVDESRRCGDSVMLPADLWVVKQIYQAVNSIFHCKRMAGTYTHSCQDVITVCEIILVWSNANSSKGMHVQNRIYNKKK